MNTLKNNTSRQISMTAALLSAVILTSAFIFQTLGYAPCKLCLWQRWPHAAAILIGGLIFISPTQTWQKPLAWAGALALSITSLLGFYHSGVERKYWEGPTSCTGGGIGDLSVEDLMSQINAAPLIRCDEIPWDLFGVTMANLNGIGSLFLVGLWVIAATRKL
jgi:disulfide bond formation protein DsbB